jgi:hypothetical protein
MPSIVAALKHRFPSRATSTAIFHAIKGVVKLSLNQGFSNFFCWRPWRFFEKSHGPQDVKNNFGLFDKIQGLFVLL